MTYAYSAPSGANGSHIWSIRGPKGGVHIWARANAPDWRAEWGEHYIGGVERHSPVPVYAFDDAEKPHHADCFLLKGPCWHDGSSLYFSENIEPMLRDGEPFSDGVHAFVNSVLSDWYSNQFGEPSA